jgi:hypothetical protein
MRWFIPFLLLCNVALAQPFQPPFDAPTVNGSVTITIGNTFQQLLAAVTNPANNATARHSLTIQNNNGNATCQNTNNCDICWIFIGAGAATKAASIMLLYGQAYTRYYPFVPSDVIQGTCLNNSDTIYVDTQ